MLSLLKNLLRKPTNLKADGAPVIPAYDRRDYTALEYNIPSTIPSKAYSGGGKATELSIPPRNQWQTSSCTTHAVITQLEYEGIIPTSIDVAPLPLYRKRYNYASEGSDATDLYKKIKEGFSQTPKTPENATEQYANSLAYVLGEKGLEDFEYYAHSKDNQVTPHTIMRDVTLGKAVVIYVYGTIDEWAQEYVTPISTTVTLYNAPVRHAVVLIPNRSFYENGRMWYSVHDSAKFGGRFLRYISQEWLEKRVYFASSVMKKTVTVPVDPVINSPMTACEFGQTGEAVYNLQAYLWKQGKLEGKYLTGYYGQLTANAVLWWQLEKYNMFTSNIPELLSLGGRYWGKQSISAINK